MKKREEINQRDIEKKHNTKTQLKVPTSRAESIDKTSREPWLHKRRRTEPPQPTTPFDLESITDSDLEELFRDDPDFLDTLSNTYDRRENVEQSQACPDCGQTHRQESEHDTPIQIRITLATQRCVQNGNLVPPPIMSNIQNAILAILNDNPELIIGSSETSRGRKRLREVYASSRMQDINNRTSRGQPLSERDLEFLSGVSDLEKQVQLEERAATWTLPPSCKKITELVESRKEETCAICFERLDEPLEESPKRRRKRKTPDEPSKLDLLEISCRERHIFHKVCIESWLKNSMTCPLDRDHIV